MVLRNMAKDRSDHVADIYFAGDRFGLGNTGQARHAAQTEPDVVARFGTSFYKTFPFEMIIGLKCRAHADAVFLAEHADGGQLIAYPERFVADEFFKTFRNLEVEGLVPGEFCLLHGVVSQFDFLGYSGWSGVPIENVSAIPQLS